MNGAGAFFLATAWPPLGAALWCGTCRTLGLRMTFYGGWVSIAAVVMFCALFAGQWLWAGVAAADALIAAILWWLSRRRKRRAPKLAGAKSKAILAAVVRTMRERSRPRPVFRPQPQGSS